VVERKDGKVVVGNLGRRLLPALLVALLVVVALGIGLQQPVAAQPPAPTPQTVPTEASPITHTLIGRSHCLICHAAGFGDAKKVPADHADYTNDTCQDCHQPTVEVSPFPLEGAAPGAIPTPIAHPPSDGTNSCYDCHVLIDEKHAKLSEAWRKSVHGKADIGCADCHGGDPRTDEMNESMAPEAGFIGVPPRILIPDVCGGCHSDVDRMRPYNLPTDQYMKYITSVHGRRLKERRDTKVAVCVDCHGAHEVKKASDPGAAVYPLNVPELCARCHSDTTLMEPYGIPTNQYELYRESVHGKALLERQDLGAANCASCHGSHAAKPPDSPEVVNVCGKCHTATENYYKESRHSKIGEAGPKCVTCHGDHDVPKPNESMFIHSEQLEERRCTTCHLNEKTYRWDKSWFERPEDRRCDTCHHEGSMIMPQVLALRTALMEADEAYRQAEQTIQDAKGRGMIVEEAEAKLAEAHTSLIQARAALHTTKLPTVGDLADAARASAATAQEIAAGKLNENLFHRRAMVVAIGVIFLNVAILSVLKREVDRELEV